jgi:beta-lactamase regulating signal transducer with metallopeptidase domain
MNLIEHFAHPIIYASGWTIVHSTWQILILFVLWLIVKQFTTKASSPVRYHLSVAVLVTSFAIIVANFVRHYGIYKNAKELTAVEIPNLGMVTTAEPMYIIDSKPMLSGIFDESSIMLIFWFYVIGMLLYACITLADHYRLKSMVSKAWQVSYQWQQTIMRLSSELGIRVPLLKISDRLSFPAVIGFIKPVIVVPLAMMSNLSTAEVESIIIHELYHIRRRDHLVNLFQQFMEILLFFHPAIWIINKHIRKERENCVDERVVVRTRDPQLYAKALLQLEELRTLQSKLAVAATQSKFHLLQRIKNIMTMKTQKSNPAHKIAGIILIVTALVSVAWINPALSINSRIDKVAPEKESQDAVAPAPATKDSVKIKKKVTAIATTSITDTLPEPTSIVVNNKTVAWADLDEELKQEIIESMKEARIAIAEAGRSIDKAEMEATLNAVKAELREAAQELKIQLEQVDSEEFKKEMENVKITIKRIAEETRPMIDSLMPVVLSAFEVAKEAALYSIIYLEDLLETATEE